MSARAPAAGSRRLTVRGASVISIAVAQKLEKELKRPDQFLSFWARTGQALMARRNAILGGFVATFVALGGVFALQEVMDRRGARTSQAVARIHLIATAALIPETGTAPTFEDDLPHFKTDKERQEAAIKAADEFLATHGRSRLADEARLLRARALLAAGRAAEAVKAYEEIGGQIDAGLAFLRDEGLAYAHEEAGALDKAIATLDALAERAKAAGNFRRDHALYNKARLLQRQGKPKDAEKVLRAVLSESPNTSLRDEINDRLALLEGK
jgi:tetratricopeptide (TPR) repeat protein